MGALYPPPRENSSQRMFHVKQFYAKQGQGGLYVLFPDAEIGENNVQQCFDIDSAG